MDDTDRYQAALQAMQAGVAMEMEQNAMPTQPKHLRVGINAAMADTAGLVRLLIEKGVFTEAEYLKAIADEMEREKARYEEGLAAMLGVKVMLR